MVEADDGGPRLQLIASYGFGGRKTLSSTLPPEGEPHRAVRVREEAHPARRRPRGLHLHRHRDGRGAAAQRRRPAGPLRGRDEGGHRARLVQARSAPNHLTFLDQLMDERRRHPQHDLLEHAHRGAAAAAQDVERRARSAGRGAQREGEAARGQEPRGRAREPQPRGEGRAAPAHLQVQERVPREHVATSCARRSTACSSSRRCSRTTATETSPPSR